MDLGSLLLILSVLLLVALFVGRPFVEKSRSAAAGHAEPGAEIDRSRFLAEYDRLLNAIQELEFDHTLGKIPAEDYPQQRAALMNQAAGVLRAMDELQPVAAAQSAEDRIEALVASRSIAARQRVPAAASVADAGDDPLEDMIAKRASQRNESSAGFCPRCGKPVQKSDVFCPKCGANLNQA